MQQETFPLLLLPSQDTNFHHESRGLHTHSMQHKMCSFLLVRNYWQAQTQQLQTNLQKSRVTLDLKPAVCRFGQVSCKEGSLLHNLYYNNRIESLTQEYPDTTPQEKVQVRKSRKVPILWCWCHAAAVQQAAYLFLGEPAVKQILQPHHMWPLFLPEAIWTK